MQVHHSELDSLQDCTTKLEMELELANVKIEGKQNQGGQQYYDLHRKFMTINYKYKKLKNTNDSKK